MGEPNPSQSLSVKRAEVEFHNFVSRGEPERALASYADRNANRGQLIRKHLGFIGAISPFLEIGANTAYTSYLLANEFGGNGFALDLSAEALRFADQFESRWGFRRAPVRLAGDAAKLPFRDGSVRFVVAFQMLSQFLNVESVFVEVKRVLAPGGVFLFGEEPLKRLLSLRLRRFPYYASMKPWERTLSDWGLLGYLARDVIGAGQEHDFGIRQNYSMGLKDWHRLVTRHFVAQEYDLFVPEDGWGEAAIKRTAILDPYRSHWRAARLLGGFIAAVCRKEGAPPPTATEMDRFEELLRCPDCRGDLSRDAGQILVCSSCGYRASCEAGVYNLLSSADRAELYPGQRDDILDCSAPNHEAMLGEGWHELEGVAGNKYRWIGLHATARLKRVSPGAQRLRVRGHAPEAAFVHGSVSVAARVNGLPSGAWRLERPGLFVLETDVPEAAEYWIELTAGPVWRTPGDQRDLTVTLSMIRLVPR